MIDKFRPFQTALLAVFALCLMTTVNAAPMTTEQSQTFLHVTGLNQTFEQVPGMMRQQLHTQRLSTSMDEETFKRVSSILMRSLDDLGHNAIALNYLVEYGDGDAIEPTIEFLQSPLGQRISAAELALNSSQAQADVAAYMANLQNNPPPQSRVDLIKRFQEAARLSEMTAQLMEGVMLGMSQGFAELNDPVGPAVAKTLKSQWAQMKTMVVDQLASQMTLQAHFTYRNFSDAELQKYIEFIESDAGQYYVDLSFGLIQHYFDAFGSNFARIMSEEMASQ